MRHLIVGMVVGLVVGIVVGSTIVAPRLKLPAHRFIAQDATASTAPAGQLGLPSRPAAADEADDAAVPAPRPALIGPDVRWRMASAYASALPQLGEMGLRLETTVWHLSGGSLAVRLHEPGTLVPAPEMFDAVRSGAIEAAFARPDLWADRNPALHLFGAIPFGPPPQEYLAWLFDGGGRQLMDDLYAKLDVHGLVCGVLTPEGSGWFRRPVPDLAAFAKLRLGIRGLAAKVAAKLGATTLDLAVGDVGVALEKDLIDGAEASQPAVDLDLGLHKLADHYYFPGWHQPTTFLHLIVNRARWDDIGESRRIQVETACRDNIAHGLAVGEARQFGALKEMTKEGVQVEAWAPEIIAALQGAWAEVQAEEAKDSRDFKAVWEALQAFREDYGIWREISRVAPPR